MSSEHSNMKTISIKICPLTGEPVPAENDREICYKSNCDRVSPFSAIKDNYTGAYCRCEREKKIAVEEYDRKIKKNEKEEQFLNKLRYSLKAAEEFDLSGFIEKCDRINKDMIAAQQRYQREFAIYPYAATDEKVLVYLFSKEVITDIALLDNVFAYLSDQLVKLKNPELEMSLSCRAIPLENANETLTRLRIINNLDVKKMVHNDNLVYVRESSFIKYLMATYGWSKISARAWLENESQLKKIECNGEKIYYKKELYELFSDM